MSKGDLPAASTSASYTPYPKRPPLCFLAVPKTASGSLSQWLESMFPVAERAPYRLETDFEQCGDDGGQYRLYNGHIIGGQLHRLAASTAVFTIIREPVESCVSSYYYVRSHVDPERAFPKLCREHTLPEIISSGRGQALTNMRDSLTRHLGATHENFHREKLLGPDEIPAVRQRQTILAEAVLERAIVVGAYDDLEGATLLLAALRGWPAPPPLPSIRNNGAPTKIDPADPIIRRAVEAFLPYDLALYPKTRRYTGAIRQRLAAICGDDTAAAVDAHHKRCFSAETSVLSSFRATADHGWSGAGWSLRGSDGNGTMFRRMTGLRATTLIRLEPNSEESRLFALAIMNGTMAAIDSLQVTCAGAPLIPAGRSWRDAMFIVEWDLPDEIVRSVGGNIELVIERDAETSADELWIFGLGCQPAA